MLKKLSYVLAVLFFILALFFADAYLQNHTYYYSMLHTLGNWNIVIFGLLSALIPSLYLIYSKKKTPLKIFLHFFYGLALFSLILGLVKGGFVSIGFISQWLNFAILLLYWAIILLGFLALGSLVLKKIKFEKPVYNFAIKFATGFALAGLLLYYVIVFHFLNVFVSYALFFALIALIYYQRNELKFLANDLIESFDIFVDKLKSKNSYLFLAFVAILALSFWYIYVGLNYTFIPYPTAWDANHAYMFIPRVLAHYDGYPWNIDFRPSLFFWFTYLAWVYKLGFWTWFAPDTWMINFNFLSGVFSLFFAFMLINALIDLFEKKESLQKYIFQLTGYILLIAWLTSGMGAFLVFVDNKTDLAVLMFVILGIFLALYALEKNKENKSFKEVLTFFALSGFLFGIANLVKPTATFDFFQTTIVISVLEIGSLMVLALILFVVGFLAYLKFRGFDKAVSPKLAYPLMGTGLVLGLGQTIYKFFKDKKVIAYLLTFVFSFFVTLIATKGVFGIFQAIYDKNINTNPAKIASALIQSTSLPTLPKQELTGALFKDLKKPLGSNYNEDNGRYVGYGDKDFGEVWWSFLVPSQFKHQYCLSFTDQKVIGCDTIYIPSNLNNPVVDNYLNKLAIKIYQNLNYDLFKSTILNTVNQAEKAGTLPKLAQKIQINPNIPTNILRAEIIKKLSESSQAQLLKQIKSLLQQGKINLSDYPQVLQTKANEELFSSLLNPKPYVDVSIPYKYLVPFNVTFNWSLQNLTSYYTDIGIIWLFLFFIVIIALLYSLILLAYGFIVKNKETVDYARKLLAFSSATLIGWTIWYFVASGIVWYDIGGIVWLIITSLVFLIRWSRYDNYFLLAVIVIIALFDIFLNLIRISSQGGGQIQTWYRSSIGKVYDYEINSNGIIPVQNEKIPYTFDDVFHLQFNMYKLPINAINARTGNQMAIIGGTYMRYFVNNQNNIKNDQFLSWLWQMGSDQNVENTYQRLKLYKLKDIVIDPNIASVVMGTGNISLWYRYYGKLDKNGNLTEKGVFPMFVDLARKGYLQYGYTNNLGIKYALIIPDNLLSKITGVSGEQNLAKLRYNMAVLRFLPRMLKFEYPDSNMGMQMYQQAVEAIYKILLYRVQEAVNNGNPIPLASDIVDVYGLYVPNIQKVLSEGFNPNYFDKMTMDEKTLLVQLNSLIQQIKMKPSNVQKILQPLMENGLGSRSQLLFVKLK